MHRRAGILIGTVTYGKGVAQSVFDQTILPDYFTDGDAIKITSLRGYSPDAERIVVFDREKMLANKNNIQYLYGQLKNVHAGNDTLQINEAFLSYSGTHWTTNKGVLLEFLYLGAAVTDYQFVRIFDSKTNSTKLNMNNITPTLSPKDPAFPAWWEAHKGEWEEPK